MYTFVLQLHIYIGVLALLPHRIVYGYAPRHPTIYKILCNFTNIGESMGVANGTPV